jgi:DnaA family protein
VAEPPPFNDAWAVVLLDDVHLYTAVQQHAAFNWFVNAQTHQRGVLAAATCRPRA